MAKKRKLDASVDESALEDVSPDARKGSMGGMWAGSAMNMLKQRIEDAHGSLMDGVKAGTVVIKLNPDQIEDSVGSDRVTNWEQDEDFANLVANIKRRGQKQPIRVRPTSKSWTPDPANPLKTKDNFYIQSGRRRLAACAKLGIPVEAVIATEDGDLALADLEERFHENTMRKALNGFEELISIGLLAASLQELTQVEIAERLGVAQGDVSLGLACLQFRDSILAHVDVANTPKREYRKILPKLKRGESLDSQPKRASPVLRTINTDGVKMVARRSGTGITVEIESKDIREDDIELLFNDVLHSIKKGMQKKIK